MFFFWGCQSLPGWVQEQFKLEGVDASNICHYGGEYYYIEGDEKKFTCIGYGEPNKRFVYFVCFFGLFSPQKLMNLASYVICLFHAGAALI